MNIAEGLNDINMAVGLAEGDELQLAVRNSAGDLHETVQNMHQIIAEPSPDMIYWVEVMRDRLSLHAAPLHVGPLVEEHLVCRAGVGDPDLGDDADGQCQLPPA